MPQTMATLEAREKEVEKLEQRMQQLAIEHYAEQQSKEREMEELRCSKEREMEELRCSKEREMEELRQQLPSLQKTPQSTTASSPQKVRTLSKSDHIVN